MEDSSAINGLATLAALTSLVRINICGTQIMPPDGMRKFWQSFSGLRDLGIEGSG